MKDCPTGITYTKTGRHRIVEPKAPPPGWDKILDKRFRQYTNNPADCPKYAVRYNKALLEIYQTGENEYYCIFPPVME